MCKKIFSKQNILPFLTFGSILISTIVFSFEKIDSIDLVTGILSIIIFFMSIVQSVVAVMEDINDALTNKLISDENDKGEIRKIGIRKIRDADDNQLKEIIIQSGIDKDYVIKGFYTYKKSLEIRKGIRFWRRIMLFIFYIIFMLMFVVLILHYEIILMFNNLGVNNINDGIITLWTLVIFVFEIIMKDKFKMIIREIFAKKYNIYLNMQ